MHCLPPEQNCYENEAELLLSTSYSFFMFFGTVTSEDIYDTFDNLISLLTVKCRVSDFFIQAAWNT